MTGLSIAGYGVPTAVEGWSRITDLDAVTIGSETFVVSSTRYDGVLRLWTTDTAAPLIADTAQFGGSPIAGGSGTFTVLPLDGAPMILTGGGNAGSLQLRALSASGTFGAPDTLGLLPAPYAGFQHGTSMPLALGGYAVFGAFAGESGVGRLRFDASGTLTDHAVTLGTADHPAGGISATAHMQVAGQDILLTVSSAANSVTSRLVTADGSFGNATTLTADDGLGISAPTALASAVVGGQAYAVLGAAGSDSLSVIEVAANGTMIMRDHLLDGRDTRFGGVTSVEVLTYGNRTYVAAAGADDGVSLFQLLEGGMLIHLSAIADTVDIGLDNVSALTLQQSAGMLSIFAASSSEAGVTHLQYDTGVAGITALADPAGETLNGGAGGDNLYGGDGNDQILANAGDDVLRDGAGADVLTGGAAADIFILSPDGDMDMITDFTLGEDRIDLSLWPMLRDISQLWFSLRPDGVQITYGNEVLIVQSAAGTSIDYRDLTNADLIGGSRLSASLQPGYPGPETPPPDPNGPPPEPDPPEPGVNDPLLPLQLLSGGNLADLRLLLENDTAGPGTFALGTEAADLLLGTGAADVMIAGGGADQVFGAAGDDTLFGRAGDDRLEGDSGADNLRGGAGDDTLNGGNGQDRLEGGDGADTLSGGIGDDQLWGDAGADTFVFDSGHDLIGDFESGVDTIQLDPVLWTGLTNAADLLLIYATEVAGDTVIAFDADTSLTVAGIADPALLAPDLLLF
ncbi:MAG: calcium-binding protein [Pseudomonadota bacterium]